MSIHFIAGSSGSGKSYTAYQNIIRESLQHPEKQFLIIVPEQFTMQTQKEVLEMHPQKGLLNVDILSFNRLAYRVFEETGGNTLPVLEETGKNLVVQRVITEVQDQLKVLGRTLTHPGAVSEMKSLISELMQYRIRPENLEEWFASSGGTVGGKLSLKMEDIRLIYSSFHRYIEHHYLTTEEVPQVMCDVIAKSELVRGSVIVMDGFTGFTPVQNQVIRELMVLAERMTFVMTADHPQSLARADQEQNLFRMTAEMYRKLLEIAKEQRVSIEPVQWISAGEKSRFAESPQLQFLEKSLFRSGRTGVWRSSQPGSRSDIDTEEIGEKLSPETTYPEIRISECADPEEEILLAAQCIRQMVRKKGYHYRDFAVVAGDLPTYGRAAAQCFAAEEIPCFIDTKKNVITNPMVELMRAAVDMVCRNYSYDSVFRFLRTGLTDFTYAEIDDLENYCRALGIRGRSKYENSWTRVSPNLDASELPYFNELREKFVELTKELHAGLHERNSSILRKCEVLYEFLVKLQIQKQMEQYQEKFESTGDPDRAKEFSQIYRQIMELLDKLVEVLGEEKMKLVDFQEILDAGFSEMKIGLIPPGEDQVLVGDIERTRLKKIKVLFFVGVNDGNIPKPIAAKGILSELDREILKAHAMELSPSSRELMYQQRFYLYLNLTKPSGHLFLSYCRAGSEGEAKLPSYLIGSICRIFPELEVSRYEELNLSDRFETSTGQQRYLLDDLQTLPKDLSDASVELLRHFRQKEEYSLSEMLLSSAEMQGGSSGLGRRLAEQLYGKELKLSVSQLEEFARCEYRHFMHMGMRLRERDEFAIGSADIGTLMHAALEKYAACVRTSGLEWGAVPTVDQRQMADQALDEVFRDDPTQILHSSHRNRYLVERLRKILYRTVWAMDEQLSHGHFRPTDFEFRITDDLETVRFALDDEVQMKLHGRVDRLDTCDFEGTHYIKIVDYKTGSTKMDFSQLYYGLQMQLAVYLNAAVEAGEKSGRYDAVEPAAIFYYHIDDPFLESEKADMQEEILKLLKPDGLVREEKAVYQLLDEELESGVISTVIPVGLKKDGNFRQGSRIADREQFRLLQDYTRSKVMDLGNAIIRGETKPNPFVSGRGNAQRQGCDYCPYGSICGFDPKIPGYKYRKLDEMSTPEAIDAMARKLSEDSMETENEQK